MNDSKPPKNLTPDTSEMILRAATSLFSEKGINGTTTRDIADLAGVNIAGLHYHWGGKEDLLKAVYQRVIQEVMGLAAHVFEGTGPSLAEGVETNLAHLHAFFTENSDYARILLHGDLEKPPFIEELRRDCILPIIRQVSEKIRTLIRAKKIRKIDPEPFLISLYGMLLIQFVDLSAQKACMGDTIENKDVAKRFQRQFIDTVMAVLGLKRGKL